MTRDRLGPASGSTVPGRYQPGTRPTPRPAQSVLTDIALTTGVLFAGVIVPVLFVQGILLGFAAVVDAFGWG